MKKQLDTESVLSELTGHSAFFRKPSSPPSIIDAQTDTEDDKPERTEVRTEFRSEKRSVSLPTKRLTRRYSFEFYDDQITEIKRLKHELDMAGERVSMSDIVRKALDSFLNKNSTQNRTEMRSENRTVGNPNGNPSG